ncbi:MAG: hypothetical protein U0354_20245 [Candidatus Sericytochromatia bacterium]
MTMIGGVQPQSSIVATGTQTPTISSAIADTPISTPLKKPDSMSSTVNTGTIPARSNLVNRIGSSTINATREVGRTVTDTLPKPEPLSGKLIGNRFISALVVGGLVNGIKTTVRVARGEYSQEEAVHAVTRDTALGAISGITLAGGMGLTASTLGRVIGGVPLSLAALTIGTLASMFATDLVAKNVSYFSEKPQSQTA